MDLLEYNEVRWPTRALQQEEEEQATSTASLFLHAPSIQWEDGTEQVTRPNLLVVVTTPATCSLLESCLAGKKAVARIVPSISHGPGAAATPTAALYAAGNAEEQVLVCCCSSAIPPAAAPAWAKGVLQQLRPQRLLVFGTVQVVEYRGGEDLSQQLLSFLLQTTAARSTSGTPAPPYLPTGSIVSGLPAALLTCAELHGLHGELVVMVDVLPALVPDSLGCLARTLSNEIARAAPGAASCGLLLEPGVVEAARRRLQRTACRPTSVYS